MPPRKSCASRIIGERAVRSMAASTSASTEASVPSTISSEDRVDSFMAVSGLTPFGVTAAYARVSR